MRHDRTDKADSPAVPLSITQHERQVLWHLAAFVVQNEIGKLVSRPDPDGRTSLSWEAPAARQALEDWFPLLDDLGWGREPRVAILTDPARYVPMIARHRTEAKGAIRDNGGDDDESLSPELQRLVDEDRELIAVCDAILVRIIDLG